MKPIKIIKNRSDIGAGTRGSDMGIDALEIAAINAGSDFFNRFPYVDVPTHNETIYDKVNNTFAKRINFVAEQCERICDLTAMVLHQKHFPLVLSGDHSSALGTLAGISKAYPNKTIGAIWIDAHADLHTPWTSPSGNVHGMPLAAALGLDNKENGINQVDIETSVSWDQIKNLGKPGPKIDPAHLIYFGLRSSEQAENKLIDHFGIRVYPVYETRYRGLTNCLDEAIQSLAAVDFIYISFDVDSLDCDLISKGTGTPVSKGFDPEEIKHILNQLLKTNQLGCIEICEINPLLDQKGNKMADTTFEILSQIFE